jgi:hypothetical protein
MNNYSPTKSIYSPTKIKEQKINDLTKKLQNININKN